MNEFSKVKENESIRKNFPREKKENITFIKFFTFIKSELKKYASPVLKPLNAFLLFFTVLISQSSVLFPDSISNYYQITYRLVFHRLCPTTAT